MTDTNQIVLLQEWENADCLQAHYQTAHMEEFLGKLGNYLESEVITRSYASQDEPRVTSASSEDLAKPAADDPLDLLLLLDTNHIDHLG